LPSRRMPSVSTWPMNPVPNTAVFSFFIMIFPARKRAQPNPYCIAKNWYSGSNYGVANPVREGPASSAEDRKESEAGAGFERASDSGGGDGVRARRMAPGRGHEVDRRVRNRQRDIFPLAGLA